MASLIRRLSYPFGLAIGVLKVGGRGRHRRQLRTVIYYRRRGGAGLVRLCFVRLFVRESCCDG